MKWIFWGSLLLVAYAYAGYPLWLWMRRRWRSRPAQAASIHPSLSVVLAVHNEAESLPGKLRNLAELDYPRDLLEVVVVSDGSTDATREILAQHEGECFRVFAYAERRGKAHALNSAIEAARGEIIVFMDARQVVAPDALRHLAANFSDPAVGAVSGELVLGHPHAARPLEGVGLYWRLEKKIRQWEGETGSVVGATGALYAVRRSLLAPLPEGTLLDDVYFPMLVVRQGARVVFEPRAVVWDRVPSDWRQEFQRKVRTLTGNYQLLQLAPWLLSRRNPLRFEFISHKLLRLLVPFALAGLLVSSLLLDGWLYRTAVLLQLSFYGLGLLALAQPPLRLLARPGSVALTFLVLNTAALVALFNFLTGKKEVWVR